MLSTRAPGRKRTAKSTALAVAVITGVLALAALQLYNPFAAHNKVAVGTEILVPRRDLPAGAVIQRGDLGSFYAPAGAPIGRDPVLISDYPRALGATTLVPLAADQPIPRMGALDGAGFPAPPGLSVTVPRGYGRYTVPAGPLDMPQPSLVAGETVAVFAAVPHAGTAGDATSSASITVETVETRVVVAAVSQNPPGVTIVARARDLAYLAYLRAHNATFSFAHINTRETGVPNETVTTYRERARH